MPAWSERALVAASVFVVAGCGSDELPARRQWVLHLGTDAHVPGFGDRLRVDVLGSSSDKCGECSRTFGVESKAELPLSIGILPPASAHEVFVRARLFRAEATGADGDPLEPALDLIGRLPEPESGSGVLHVRMALTMSCFGQPVDEATLSSCDPSSGTLGPAPVLPIGGPGELPVPSSWLGGDRPCESDPPPGMVCIAGGPFLLGNRTYVPFGPGFDPVPVQLVRVSPFHLDVDEMTVETYRKLVGPNVNPPLANDPTHPLCQYTASPAAKEHASVNCISHADAAAACAALGKRLPTEAEWEYAAGGRSLETPYPWPIPDDSNEALCRKAVLARGAAADETHSRMCILLLPGLTEGPSIGGSDDDVTDFGLYDMGGNLSEWVADDFVPFADPTCWGPDLVLHENPRCVAGAEATLRGGSFASFPYNSHAYFRRGAVKGYREPWFGVRCAMNASSTP